jgi:hypothetical protein
MSDPRVVLNVALVLYFGQNRRERDPISNHFGDIFTLLSTHLHNISTFLVLFD